MAKIQNPVIVVPGITGTSLRDEYPVAPDSVWSQVLNKAYDRIALHPDDIRYELMQPSMVRADSAFPLIYSELVEELRHNLTDEGDKPVPVFVFAYDWRQPLAVSELKLEAFVSEVIDRTKLLRYYFKTDWYESPEIDLVGHSMGGMLIAGYLERLKKKARVGKVATIATPFRGSCESVIKILTGTAMLGPLQPASREREAARLTPALYHLTPSYSDAIHDLTTGADVDGFEVTAWQTGVVETLSDYIRINGVDPGKSVGARTDEAITLLESMLDAARAYHDRLEALDLAKTDLDKRDWLAIVGVDSKTRVQLPVTGKPGSYQYLLKSELLVNDWPSHLTSTGDGTVPFAGAECAFLERNRMVCLSPDDLGPFELADKALLAVAGWHADLPNVDLVHRLIVRHLKGEPGDERVGGRIPPGVTPDEWDPPIKNLRAK
jgi:pimeloyl-ACP methyl ester carboxylesterase